MGEQLIAAGLVEFRAWSAAMRHHLPQKALVMEPYFEELFDLAANIVVDEAVRPIFSSAATIDELGSRLPAHLRPLVTAGVVSLKDIFDWLKEEQQGRG